MPLYTSQAGAAGAAQDLGFNWLQLWFLTPNVTGLVQRSFRQLQKVILSWILVENWIKLIRFRMIDWTKELVGLSLILKLVGFAVLDSKSSSGSGPLLPIF